MFRTMARVGSASSATALPEGNRPRKIGKPERSVTPYLFSYLQVQNGTLPRLVEIGSRFDHKIIHRTTRYAAVPVDLSIKLSMKTAGYDKVSTYSIIAHA